MEFGRISEDDYLEGLSSLMNEWAEPVDEEAWRNL